MSSLGNIFFGCVSDRSQDAATRSRTTPKRLIKVKFGVPLSEALKDDCIPIPLVDMLVYIAQDGVTTTDLFRRPGNPTDAKTIMKKMAEGKEVDFSSYNFYTLATVLKKFLLSVPGGIFGPAAEENLLHTLDLQERVDQYSAIHSIIQSLPPASQQLLTLLFGTWFRIVNHSEYNTMSSEAVAKSVAGSLFHTCAMDLQRVNRAVQVLQILIDDFGVSNMFGPKNIQYFADMTRTGIRVREKYKYEYKGSVPSISEEEFYSSTRSRSDTKESGESNPEMRMPPSPSPPSPQSLQPHLDGNPHRKLTAVSSLSAPEVNEVYSHSSNQDTLSPNKRIYLSSSLSRFDNVRRRQLIRMKKRSSWFLSPHPNTSSENESMLGSREASVGKSSLDGLSSDALMSDITQSDGGMSDTPERLRLSDIENIDDSFRITTSTPASKQPAAKSSKLHTSDIVNGNSRLSPRPTASQSHSPPVSERDVRYFMVESWYSGSDPTSDPPS